MPKKNGRPSKIEKQPLSSKDFGEKHAREIDQLFRFLRHSDCYFEKPFKTKGSNQFTIAMIGLQRSGVGDLLRAAALENSPQAYKAILTTICISLGATPPEGVFVPDRRKPGKKGTARAQWIRACWNAMGRPETGKEVCLEIAKKVYPKANSWERSTKIPLVRAIIHRYKTKLNNEIRKDCFKPYR
jgi:hypothetical protein